MRRYQILLKRATEAGGGSMRALARTLGVPVQSLSNYLLDGTEPRLANLEKMSVYFGESVSTLLAEFGEESSIENQIIEEMTKLDNEKKKLVLELIRGLN